MCVLTQLPPDFVDQAIQKANQPAGASEHYTQIFHACGGGENGTAIVSSCLEQVEYCVRPIQGHHVSAVCATHMGLVGQRGLVKQSTDAAFAPSRASRYPHNTRRFSWT